MTTQPVKIPVCQVVKVALAERYPWGTMSASLSKALRDGVQIDRREGGARAGAFSVRMNQSDRMLAAELAALHSMSRREYLARVLEAMAKDGEG